MLECLHVRTLLIICMAWTLNTIIMLLPFLVSLFNLRSLELAAGCGQKTKMMTDYVFSKIELVGAYVHTLQHAAPEFC